MKRFLTILVAICSLVGMASAKAAFKARTLRADAPFARECSFTGLKKAGPLPFVQAGVPQLAGVMIHASSWTLFNMPYGAYALPWTGCTTFKPLAVGNDFNAYYGGVYVDGKLLTIGPGAWEGSEFKVHDTDTWELTKSGTSPYDFIAVAMAAQPGTNTIYTCYYSDDFEEYHWGTFSLDIFEASFQANLRDMCYSGLAFAPDGTLYGITGDGILAKVNLATGAAEYIGNTGLNPEALTSAVYDARSSKIFYALSSDACSALYAINPATGASELLYDMPEEEEIVAMYIPKSSAADGAPAVAENLAALFEGGTLEGTVQFTVPAYSYDGTSVSGNVNYTVKIDGTSAVSGSTTYSSMVNAPVTVASAGVHEFEVVLTNDHGDSPAASVSRYVGHDTPAAVKGLAANYNGAAFELSWQVAEGVHGGYMDAEEVTYTIVRKPGDVLVAQGVKGTSYTDPYAEPSRLVTVSYDVTANYQGKESAPSTSAGLTVGVLAPPFADNFATGSLAAYTVLDDNNDNITWKSTQGCAYYSYSVLNAASDYLVTPALRLDADQVYTFGFGAYASNASKPERVAVYAGASPTAESLTTTVLAPMTVASTETQHFEGVFVPKTSGVYYFAIKACSPAGAGNLYVSTLSVSAPSTAAVPAAVGSLAVQPGDYGALTATVSFLAPATDMAGNALAAIDRIEISLDGVLAKTVQATPGAQVSETLAVTEAGRHEIAVTAFNAHGAGLAAKTSAYIGLAKALAPEYISAIEGDNAGQMIVSWAPVQRDVNGMRMQASQVRYNLYRLSGNQTQIIATGLKMTSFVDQAVPEGSDSQIFVQYAALAVNDFGDGYAATTPLCIAGESYQLPFAESVAGGILAHPMAITGSGSEDDYWSIATDDTFRDSNSQDADNGYIAFQGSRDAEGSLTTGRISLRGTSRPMLSFWLYCYGTGNSNTVAVAVSSDGVAFTTLQTEKCDGATGWRKVDVDLSGYAGREVQLRFIARTVNFRVVHIDNITVRNVADHDMAVSALELPATVVRGKGFDGTIRVVNNGFNEETEYTVLLLRDGTQIGLTPGEPLQPGESIEYEFTDWLSPLYAQETVRYMAYVVLATDQELANNELTIDLPVTLPTHPAPANLRVAGSGESHVALEWDAPEAPAAEAVAVTDGAEDYVAFSTGLATSAVAADNVGGWTMVDADGSNTIGAKDSDNQMLFYPNARTAMAFQIFEPAALGLTADMWQPRSGGKMWICFSSLSRANDDWMISPLLSGEAQTVSFYARSASSLYGLESLEVLASPTKDDADFVKISSIDAVPTDWTKVECTVPAGTNYFAIRCTSDDRYALCIDDVSMSIAGGDAELEHLGYHVYCNGVRLTDGVHASTAFTHAQNKDAEYCVTAVYNHGESLPSNTVQHISAGITGVDAARSSVRVEGRTIVVEVPDAKAAVAVYGADGRTVFQGVGSQRIPVPAGVYVVRAGSHTAKVHL